MAEDKKRKSKRQKDIGQFFTPREVVEFIYDILKVHLDKEEKWRTYVGKKQKKLKKPSIIDPACGEGVFLKIALEKNITYPSHIFGVDIDDGMKEEWRRINLLTEFGSEARLESRFFYQNGLLPIKHDPKYKYRGIKKNALKEFDLVVGNPPYGGVGLKEITPELEKALLGFDVWRRALRQNDRSQGELFDKSEIEVLGNKRKKRLQKLPIEILFIDRFIQLTKPGGHIAIIVPDGILSNSNLHYVREFIAGNVKVEAIVSLPRDTFKNVGTSAKTSIIVMTKPLDGKIGSLDYPVFLATVQNLEGLTKVYELYCRYQKEGNLMNPIPEKVLVVKDSDGNEAVTIRVDITLRKMFEQKPMTRWDAPYWDPSVIEYIDMVTRTEHTRLGNYIDFITYGVITTGAQRKYDLTGTVWHINQINVRNTGLEIHLDERKIRQEDKRNAERCKPLKGDILFNRDQVGTMGRCCVFLHDTQKYVVNDHVDIIRVNELNPFYMCIFLLTQFGSAQVNRFGSGVSGIIGITFEQIKSVLIPLISEKVQENIESKYKKMSAYHGKAMDAKLKGDEVNYKKNIATAEKMLRDLIARTESVIRGEKDDIV